jgi:glutathione synthase/RimK-type ligase-like ATP-grasp enzyme
MNPSPHTLGITVTYLPTHRSFEHEYFYQLSCAAHKYNLEVIAFDPRQINWQKRTAPAWRVDRQRKWSRRLTPLPPLIYDRCFYHDARHYRQYKTSVRQLYQDPRIHWLGRPLQGKYHTYSLLRTHESIASCLPETRRYTHSNDIVKMMRQYGDICLKPNGGSHGRGVLVIHRQANQSYLIRGRDRQNRAFHFTRLHVSDVVDWCHKFIGTTRYIIQPYLTLTTADGTPFDLRLLIQKNEQKLWTMTGSAIRVGHPRSITSNLHGGGKAVSWESFCQDQLPREQLPDIIEQIKQCTRLVPTHIEQKHGPLVELGIDIGIDRQGRVWLLEVNSKPGRSVFLQTGDHQLHQLAIEKPLRYAQALLSDTKEVS